jgi:pimeloyl-ACP methyl ester carboxylesterase/DNA-binding CsgD family transcriptional regulator
MARSIKTGKEHYDRPMPLQQRLHHCTSADGVRLAYATSGQGPPLVKASNWISHLEFDLTSPVWSHMVEALSRDHLLVRYDQRASGMSQWSVQRLDFDAWVGDLEAVVDAAGLDRFALVGISQGASIAATYAARHPQRVTRLVVYGAYARGRLRRSPTPAQREEAELMLKLTELGWGKKDPTYRQFFATQFVPDGTVEQHDWFNELARISTSPENAVRMMRVSNDIDVTDVLPQVRCPVLVMHATRDARVPFDEGRLFASALPDARFVPLESGNHLLLRDEPAWQRWVDELRAFLPAAPQVPADFAALTPRELQLLELVAQGRDNEEIAAALGLSAKTVRNHVTRIYAKLDVEGRAQAIVRARDAGFGQSPASSPG